MKNVTRAFRHCYLAKYANFTGKTDRKNYWYFTISMFVFTLIATALCTIVGAFIYSLIGHAAGSLEIMGIGLCALLVIAIVLFIISLSIPFVSATIRRLRDAGMSPYYFLWLRIVPLIAVAISQYLYRSSIEDGSLKLIYYACYMIDFIALIYFIVMLAKPSINTTVEQ